LNRETLPDLVFAVVPGILCREAVPGSKGTAVCTRLRRLDSETALRKCAGDRESASFHEQRQRRRSPEGRDCHPEARRRRTGPSGEGILFLQESRRNSRFRSVRIEPCSSYFLHGRTFC